jgi:predicted RNA-binding protein with TRAM domain
MNYEQPINEGDILDVKIESTGAKGDGIAKINNFVIIVPNVQEGDEVKVKITRVLNKMAFAEVVEDEESQNDTPETEVVEDEESQNDAPEAEAESENKAE